MTTGQYVFFLAAAMLAAIVLVLIKSRQVEDEDGGQIEITYTGHQIEGQAMRCAQRIGARVGLAPKAIRELKRKLVYVHHSFAGSNSSREIGDEFAQEAVAHLRKIGEFSPEWDEESVKATISEIVTGSLNMDEADTLPLQP
jgi:hypothetical protein